MTAAPDNLPPLRVGVILPDERVPAWIDHLLRRIIDAEFVRLAAWSTSPVATSDRKTKPCPKPLWLYRKLEGVIAPAAHNALKPVDAGDILATVPRRHHATAERPNDVKPPASTAHARLIDPVDVVIDLTDGASTDLSTMQPRLGAWVVRGGPNGEDPIEQLGVREFVERATPLHTWIVRTHPDRADDLLDRAVHAVDLSSLARTRSRACRHLADLAMRCLRRAWDGRLGEHLARPERAEPARQAPSGAQQLRDRPQPSIGIGLITKQASRFVRNRITTKLNHYRWELAIRPITQPDRLPDNLDGFRAIQPPPDRLWADPMALDLGDKTHLFFEDMALGGRRGVISYGTLTPEGQIDNVTTVLETDGHLSYPFVLKCDDQVYMVPESADTHSVMLYRAVEFPRRWEPVATLFEGVRAVDATMLQHDKRWWLFTNIAPQGGSTNVMLHLFSADSPRGPWRPHRLNPIVSDVRRARPAGAIVTLDGVLHRPAQDCSQNYGGGVVFNRIDRLDEQRYEETPVGRLTPEPDSPWLGVHTYTRAAGFEIIDRWRFVRRTRGAARDA